MHTRQLFAVSALVAAAVGSIATSPARWEASDSAEADFELSTTTPALTYALTVAANDAAVPDADADREVVLSARVDFAEYGDDAVIEGTLFEVIDGELVEVSASTWSAADDTDAFAALYLDAAETLESCPTEGCERELQLQLELVSGAATGRIGVEAAFRVIGTNDGPDDAELDLAFVAVAVE